MHPLHLQTGLGVGWPHAGDGARRSAAGSSHLAHEVLASAAAAQHLVVEALASGSTAVPAALRLKPSSCLPAQRLCGARAVGVVPVLKNVKRRSLESERSTQATVDPTKSAPRIRYQCKSLFSTLAPHEGSSSSRTNLQHRGAPLLRVT